MRIIDAFPYFNEEELVEARLRYYEDLVDEFIVVESNQSWIVKPNEQKFHRVLEKLPKKLQDKIHYKFVKHPDEWLGNRKRWKWPEVHTKNEMAFIACEKFDDNDLFMFSDLDEFWDKRQIEKIKQTALDNTWFTCVNSFHICYVDWLSNYGNDKWWGSRGTLVKNLKHNDSPLFNDTISFKKSKNVTQMREQRQLALIEYNGWHLAKLGNEEIRLQYYTNIPETRSWEERSGMSLQDIVKASNNLQSWNNSVVKRKLAGNQLSLDRVKEILDPNLFAVLKDYKTFWSGVYEV